MVGAFNEINIHLAITLQMTLPSSSNCPRVLESTQLSLWQTFFSWFLIALLPALFLTVAASRVVREEEWAGRLIAERHLMAEMGEFIRELEPDRILARSIEKTEQELGLSFSNLRPKIASGPQPELSPESILPGFRQKLSVSLPAPPLTIAFIGPDYEEVSVFSDPRFFEESVAPSVTAWKQLFFYLSRGKFRRGLMKSGAFDRLSAKFSTPEQQERLKEFSRKFLASRFDDYFPFDLVEGKPFSFFSPRYGLGRLLVVFRTFAGSPSRDEPFLGGYFLVVRDADVPREFVLNSAAGAGRGWTVDSKPFEPAFIETPAGLEYVFPAPPGLFPLTIEADGTVKTVNLVVRLPSEDFSPSIVKWKPFLAVLGVVWLAFGWLFFRRLHRGTLIIPLKISGQLRLGLTLMVGMSLCALFLFSWSFESVVRQQDERQMAKRFELHLDLLEGRAQEYLSQRIRKLWEIKNSWDFFPTMPVGKINDWLDTFLERGHGLYAHLVCRDEEWIRISEGRGTEALSGAVQKRVGDTLRLLALHQMISFDRLHLSRGEEVRKTSEKRWGKDILMLAREQIMDNEMPFLVGVDGQDLDIRLTGLREEKVTQFQIRKTTPSGSRRLEGVLFLIQRSEGPLDSFFQQGWEQREWFLPPSLQHPFQTAVFGIGPRGVDVGRCWPPSAALDPALRKLAQLDALTSKIGRLTLSKPDLGEARVLRNMPYVAVCVGQNNDQSSSKGVWGWKWQLVTVLWLLGLVGLASRFLARGFLLPIQHLAEAGEEVSRGNFQRVLAEEESGPEFLAISQEFNRMNHGLREGRLLARFVSVQATTAGQQGKLGLKALTTVGERRTVVIMFSHISDFVRVTASLSPDQIMDLLSRYFSIMEPIIENHGGMIDKYIGDAIMAVFPVDSTDEGALRAAEAALTMRRALKTFNMDTVAPFPVIATGIGMAEGEVIAGQVGSRTRRLDFTVIGDVVNLAARLEALRDQLPPDAVILNEVLASRLKKKHLVHQAGNLAIKGKAQDVPVFFLIAEPSS